VIAMTRTTARHNGFSLVELMVTITVAAILLAIALPSFRNVIHRNQVTAASNDVLASLAYARSEAIGRGQMVSMCPSSDGATCTAAGQDFAPGWMVYTYPAGAASANKAYDAATSLLLRATPARAGVSIRSKSAEIVTFGQQGQLDSATTTPEPSLTFVTCYTDSTTTGTSTTAVPGAELGVNGSGSVQTTTVTSGGSCAP
jgi:type IV fimbrial biogenesis protein FimT